jgi:hypothetical protein
MPPLANRKAMPTVNWDAVYAEQSVDPSGNLSWKATRNRKAEGSMSDVTPGSDYPTGTSQTALGRSSEYLSGPNVRQKGDDLSDGSQYDFEREIEKVPDGTGRVARIIAALADLDDDEADELMDAIAARDGRGVARLTRAAGQLPQKARDLGALRTPQSVYGGSAPPMRNVANAADYLAYTSGLPGCYGGVESPTANLFGAGRDRLTAEQRRDPMPSPNWDAAYAEDSAMRDEQRLRG